MMEEGVAYDSELLFDDEDDAWSVVKHFKTRIEPIVWTLEDEEN